MTTAGTLTFVFTDLVGSTDLLTEMGDDAAVALHHQVTDLLRRTMERHRGREVKSLGDGLMLAFGSAVDAVEAAVEMQEEIAASDLGVSIRIGINSGEPIARGEDYHGTPVVTAQRLCDLAVGGQTLVSGVTRALAGGKDRYSFVALGRHALKGLAGTTEVWAAASFAADKGESALQPQVPFPTVVSVPVGGRLVGRSEVIDRLDELWGDVSAGNRRLVLVAGEPGIGKTAAVATWSQRAFEAGAVVVAGRSAPEEVIPYQPFVEIIHQLLADRGAARAISALGPQAAELSRLVPDLAAALPKRAPVQAEPGTERYLLYEAVVAALHRVAEDAPVVAILDDLHWADAPTVGLVSHLARHPSQGRLLVVGTYRETDLGRTHPLAATLAELRRGRFFERIRLSGLDPAGVAEMIEVEVGESAPQGVAEAIWAQTEGNPFFVEEVVANLLESELIGPGVPWPDSTQLHRLEIPEGIREVIGRRLSRLSEATNVTLTTAAVLGREFDGELLEVLSQGGDGSAIDHLDEALAARILVEMSSVQGRYGFSHALIRQTLYEELNPTRRARLHGRVAEALAARDGSPAALARHYTAAHQPDKALAASVAAAIAAENVVAVPDASRHYLQALDLWPEVENPEAVTGLDRPELLRRAAEVTHLLNGGLGRAVDLALEAERSIDAETDPLRAGVIAERLGRYLWIAGRGSEAIDAIERAIDLIPAEPPTRERAKALAALAGVLMLSAQHRAAEPRALEAIDVARRFGDRAVEAHALVTMGTVEGLTGRIDDGIEHILEGRRISEEERAIDDILRSYSNLSSILDVSGRLEEAVVDALAGARAASEAGLFGKYHWFHRCNAAGSLIRLGRWQEAEPLLFEGGGGDAEGISQIYLFITRATIAALTGRFSEARGYIETAMDMIGGVMDPQLHGPAHWVAALIEWFDGDLDLAWRFIESGIDRVQKGEDWFYRAPLHVLGCAIAVDRAVTGHPEDERRSAEALVRIMQSVVAQAEGVDFPAQLAQAEAELTRFDGAGDPAAWARARTLWEAIPQPYDSAYCGFREGQARLALGGEAEGTRLLSEAAAIAERLGAAPLQRLMAAGS